MFIACGVQNILVDLDFKSYNKEHVANLTAVKFLQSRKLRP